MKKVITVLSAVLLVFGIAGIAVAQDIGDCGICDEPGFINRGCDTAVQGETCPIFDFNDTLGRIDENGESIPGNEGASYCDAKGDKHRAAINICDCDPEFYENFEAGDLVDVQMEIYVDSGDGREDGQNGVYWAENVNSNYNGIYVVTDNCDTIDLCNFGCYPTPGRLPAPDFECGSLFNGPFEYQTGDATYNTTSPSFTESCTVPEDERFTVITPDDVAGTGYMLTQEDLDEGNCAWGFDIPAMRVDYDQIQGGEEVWVRVSLGTTGGLCQKGSCECWVKIGTLCCPEVLEAELLFPYVTPLDDPDDYWYGLTLTNPTDSDGTATITLYENDGDVYATDSITIDANSNVTWINKDDVNTMMSLFHQLDVVSETDGDKGDERGYIVVEGFRGISGFIAIGNAGPGYSFTYLPQSGNF